MQAQEALQKQLRKIAAATHGQVSEVRTFQGRQLMFLQQNSQLLLLPYIESDNLQNSVGTPFFMVNIDPVNGTETAGIK